MNNFNSKLHFFFLKNKLILNSEGDKEIVEKELEKLYSIIILNYKEVPEIGTELEESKDWDSN